MIKMFNSDVHLQFKCEIFISKVLTIMSFGPAVYRQGVGESVG